MIIGHVHGFSVFVSGTPSSVCAGATVQLQASAVGGAVPYTYEWSSNPPGFSSSSPIPTVIPFVTTWYIVTVTDGTSAIAKDSIKITVNHIPITPGAITGITETCKDSSGFYSVVEVDSASYYKWTVPSDAIVETGQLTSVVFIQWGLISGTISVKAGNVCGESDSSYLPITLYSSPSTPGAITGPTAACKYSTVTYSVGNTQGASSYIWTVPPDADILNGQGFRVITVHWGESAGTVAVSGHNFCGTGNSSSKSVSVELMPGAAGVITGKDQPCKGKSYQYSVSDISNATTYIWTIPHGASINGASNGKQILVDFPDSAASDDIKVRGHSICGDGTEATKPLTIVDCTGVNDQVGDELFSVYPNPTHGKLKMRLGSTVKTASLRLTDLTGKEVSSWTLLNIVQGSEEPIELSGIAPGVYIFKCFLQQPKPLSEDHCSIAQSEWL